MLPKNFHGEHPSLNEIFHDLNNRLYNIKNGKFLDDDGDYLNPELVIRSVTEYVVAYKFEESTGYIDKHIQEIELIKSSIEDIFKKSKTIQEETKLEIIKELDYYEGELNKIQNRLLPPVDIAKTIKTNLTVPELAYLFKILFDEKIISDKMEKESLYKLIAQNFSTKKAEVISSDSFKNHFLTPNSKALDFWDEKLLHLRQRLQKDEENKGK